MELETAYCDNSSDENFSLVEEFHEKYANCSRYLDPNEQLSKMERYQSILQVFHVFCTILPILFLVAIATTVVRKFLGPGANGIIRSKGIFIVEFLLIVLPTILNVTVANYWVEAMCAIFLLSLLVIMWRKNCLELARTRNFFELGVRPYCLTFDRAVINIITVICILAIDFKSFPKEFYKSRQFGSGIMDTGIGLFVFAMGTVSRTPRRIADLGKLTKAVVPILILGIARTVMIHAIDYPQDETEYGKHLNAFFTLGFTKFFGTLVSSFVCYDIQLVPLGIGILASHELALMLGLYEFVFNEDLNRDTFFIANREGICSLPGFISIFLLSMYIGRVFYTEQTAINYSEYTKKLQFVTKVSIILWLLLIICIESVGISRRVCNFGYAVWILSLALTMSTSFMVVSDLVVNTAWSLEETPAIEETASKVIQNLNKQTGGVLVLTSKNLPSILEAINLNGLLFFVIGNILTGLVNIFLNPEKRTDGEALFILTCYMLLNTTIIYILYKFQIRIA